MLGVRLQRLRSQANLTQQELAAHSGVSRALVSAVEAGRHLPRVDAAIALASALGTTAEALFGRPDAAPVDALTGDEPPVGVPVRVGLVGDLVVTAAPRRDGDGWEIVDGIAGRLDAESLIRMGPSVVLAGCEPGLVLLERILREHGTRALAIGASSAAAIAALEAGRLHAAAVHFPDATPPSHDAAAVLRIHLARWRVGLAAPCGSARRWWSGALAGRVPIIQCAPGAAAQAAFERVVRRRRAAGKGKRKLEGPRAHGPLAASRQCLLTGMPAVTIEPAAAAVGVAFHPLEMHDVELWISAERRSEPGVERLLDELNGQPYRRTLESVGAYDLSRTGSLIR